MICLHLIRENKVKVIRTLPSHSTCTQMLTLKHHLKPILETVSQPTLNFHSHLKTIEQRTT